MRYLFFLLFSISFTIHAQTDTSFVALKSLSMAFSYDMRYATNNNFLNETVYACNECLLRNEVAKALIIANDHFLKHGYHIKLFDCYRPLDVQKKMWVILPDARYVADPAKGSIHNRGGAVDITLVDAAGKELEMGTGFDHFGKEAHHTYQDLPDQVLKNRILLKKGMERAGFRSIKTEWWHYNYTSSIKYPVSNFIVTCDE